MPKKGKNAFLKEKSVNNFNRKEIEKIIASAGSEQVPPELAGVIYSLGRDAENDEEYEYSFRLLTGLFLHKSAYVKSMVILGYSLLALYHEKLNRKITEPLIREAWAATGGDDKIRVKDAADDINRILKWNIIL